MVRSLWREERIMAVKPNTRWTEDTRTAFLLALKQHGRVIDAAAAIGRHASSAYSVKRRDADFAARWDAVVAETQEAWIAEREEARRGPSHAERDGRERRDGWNAERRARFIALLSDGEPVKAACAAVGLCEAAAYRLRARSPQFAAAWERALVERMESPIEAAYRRAIEGWEEPVVFQGQVVAHKRRYSDAALRLLIQREDKRLAQATARARAAADRSCDARLYALRDETDRVLLAKLADLERKRGAHARREAVEFADRMTREGKAP
jgi:hypothetical protein